MRRVWNGLIVLFGAVAGRGCRFAVRRGWLHFPFLTSALATLPFSFGWKMRREIYSHILPRIGKAVILHPGVVLDDPRTSIGDDVWISVGCFIDHAVIGDNVLIGPHTVILAGARQHRMDRLDIPIKHQGNPEKTPVRIDSGAWIGANVTIMADVGTGAVVGAGSVVTRSVPPFAVVAGNPARVLRDRNTTNESHGEGAGD